MPLGIYPTVDYVFKRLFGDPANADLLIHLLNAVLRPAVPIVAVTIENPFLEKEWEEDKLSVLDILATDEAGRKFNVEMQTTVPFDLPERLVYYASNLLASQLGEAEPYADLCPVISICFLTGALFPHLSAPHLRFSMADLENGVTLTEVLQVHLIELIKYNLQDEQISQAGGLEKWSFFLRYASFLEADELRHLLPESPFRKATGILEMISQSPEQRLLHEARLKAQRDRASAADYAERSRQLGREEGELVGEIKLLQKLCGEPVFDDEKLATLRIADLRTIAAQLRTQFDQQRRE